MSSSGVSETDSGPTADEYAYGDMLVPVDALVGLSWRSDRGELYRVVVGERQKHPKNGKRIVTMRVSSYTEIGSFGASHWYGELRVDVDVLGEDGVSHSGYLGKNAPRGFTGGMRMRATRKIRAGEKDALGRRVGKRGEETERLDSKEQARKLCIELFKRRFAPGWVLIADSVYDDEQEILAET